MNITRRASLIALTVTALAVPLLPGLALAEQEPGGRAVAPTDLAQTPPAGPGTLSIGGQRASVKDYPFMIGGLREGGPRPQGQTCTGSVIAPRKILSAAHCADAAGAKSFLYGLDDLNAGGGFRTKVLEYKKHPKYVNFDQGYDVAVVTVADDIPVPGGAYAKVATSADTGLHAPGKTGLGLGYGKKDHNDNTRNVELHKFELPIVEGSNCNGVGAGFREATMICSGYPDGRITILQGDSGGPLTVDGKVVGVASWSRSDFRWYSVYGRLNNDMGDWVKLQLEGGEEPPPGDIKLALSPDSGSARPGGFLQTKVTVTGGGQTTLTATGAPAGTSVFFSPATVSSGGTSTAFVWTGFNTPAGSYPLKITGTSNGKTGSAEFVLTVTR
ncbi:trypsin-like serine protease [Crossiella cryophila]|uniref:Secreted trypsin-like serine protease n=1 Tax=Crossiella cryophila TaxID=43355 RepID=A0A7W7C8H2_9PSEU|nr:trypsin-like serine protease [Crossiella cryophila]MBB4676450.1 secreted trypsin-like serine protease [Crossiella cryophila]